MEKVDFTSAILNVKNIYDVAKEVTDIFIDKTNEIIDKIGEKELNSAIRTFNDVKKSNDKYRELSSAITQLRLGIEKFEDSNSSKFETALLLSYCYKIINDENLKKQYGSLSKQYFKDWINIWAYNALHGKLNHRIVYEGILENKMDEIGIPFNKKYTEHSFWDDFWNSSTYQKEEIKGGVDNSINYFNKLVDSIIS